MALYKHLNDRKPDSHQVSVFCVFGVGFHFSYAANIRIIMILYDFCLFPAHFRYKIIYVWNLEGHIVSSVVRHATVISIGSFLVMGNSGY
jgi:hypothetical protein